MASTDPHNHQRHQQHYHYHHQQQQQHRHPQHDHHQQPQQQHHLHRHQQHDGHHHHQQRRQQHPYHHGPHGQDQQPSHVPDAGRSALSEIDRCMQETESDVGRRTSSSSSSQPTSPTSPTSRETSETRSQFIPMITKTHWVDKSSAKTCSACKQDVGWLSRDNCRRCGKVFCRPCVSSRRRLSPSAHPDPTGLFYRVCRACWVPASKPCGPGAHRSLTQQFKARRHAIRSEREKVVKDACAKLTTSFASQNTLARVLAPLSLGVPEWSKVNFLPADVIKAILHCLQCHEPFGLFRRKRHCHLCGKVYCEACLLSSLQVYKDQTSRVIIEPVGEGAAPAGAQFLMVCAGCLDALQRAIASHWLRQSQQGRQFVHERFGMLARIEPAMAELEEVYAAMSFYRKKIETALPEVENVVDTLHHRKQEAAGRGQVPKLAKHQADLSDLFTEYTLSLRKVKRVIANCSSDTQIKMTSNLVSACATFYREHLWRFRTLKKDLEDSVPPEVLNMIQATIDAQVLRYAYVVINQLAIESMVFPALQPFTEALMDCAAVVAKQGGSVCQGSEGDTWDEETLIQLVQERGKSKPLITNFVAMGAEGQTKAVRHTDTLLRTILRHMEAKGSLGTVKGPAVAVRAAWTKLAAGST
eukprot:m.413840 g.413840  ORF g.413840 m.413840 type:complete len:642 (-) comp20174_c2_seq3:91-2016(-)